MIIVDTDVMSSLIRDRPDGNVIKWLNRQRTSEIWTTVISIFELEQGIALLPPGTRRRHLESSYGLTVTKILGNRVLPLDATSASIASDLSAFRKSRGLNIAILDTFIAGITISNRARLATRNERHFPDLDFDIINPWNEAPD